MRTLALALLLAATPALAVYQCGDTVDSCQCGKANPYPCCDNGGNCTWYAWEAACCNWGVGLPGWGNANQWAGNAGANASYQVLGYPVTSAVSCRTLGTYGHVAYVTALSGSNITVKEQNCWGNYGMDVANYSSTFFQAYIVRAGQVECKPGDTQTQACGNCGTQQRGCGNDGKWAGWGACGAQGECAPGDTDTKACGECGSQQRSCSDSCHWNAWPVACEAGADPDGGTLACDTGQKGACADGRLRCEDGGVLGCQALRSPEPETCDDVDNDCNGLVDDGLQCIELSGGRVGGSGSPSGAHQMEAVHGGCSATGGLGALALWVGAGVLRRRRRS